MGGGSISLKGPGQVLRMQESCMAVSRSWQEHEEEEETGGHPY